MEHITYEELRAFVWLEQITPENREMILRINSHLMICTECADKVAKLQATREKARKLWMERERLVDVNRRVLVENERLRTVNEALHSEKNR